MQLVVATGNRGKLKEIRKLLDESGIDILGLDDLGGLPEIIEDGHTFEENALKKADTVARATGLLTLADDSGLVVDALDGAPGVFSARYAGEGAGDDANNRKLLQGLAGLELSRRSAAFCCVMALCRADGWSRVFHGRVTGLITMEPRGDGGFGYDPLFLVPEYGRTMAELSLDIKNRISHRGQALRQAIAFLKEQTPGIP
ncbi:MAG: XTP/dITP diphosphatase [Syntrophotaleaceae bacterium]